jgi:hypothetical protein
MIQDFGVSSGLIANYGIGFINGATKKKSLDLQGISRG